MRDGGICLSPMWPVRGVGECRQPDLRYEGHAQHYQYG
jgi:hypothetical protein